LRAQSQAAPRQRVVNLAPQGVAELFKDRTAPMADILGTLLAKESSLRVVTVFGQGGIGKTALACKVMRELEQRDEVLGLVYLSARTKGISFEHIYQDSARMLGGDAEQKLMSEWKNEESGATARKIQTLLEAFGFERYVLLLDNLESVMDDRGVLAEADLQLFLNAFLSQNHGARLLVTTREPLNPASENRKYQKLVPLDQGLPGRVRVKDQHGNWHVLRARAAKGEGPLGIGSSVLLVDHKANVFIAIPAPVDPTDANNQSFREQQ